MATVICDEEDVPVGRVVLFQVEGAPVAVANIEGKFYAFEDLCSHRGCSLAEGMLEGTSIICPCHSSVFQVTDGAVLGGPATRPQRTYAVEVRDGKVSIENAGDSPSETGRDTSASPQGSTHQPEGASGAQPPSPMGGVDTPDGDNVGGALASVPLFADLDPESLERLEAFAFRKRFSAGEVIVEEGHTGNGLYVVLSGTVDVIKGLGSSHPQKVAVLRAGEPFGEMALLGDWKRSASVLAVDDVECLGMDRWAFLAHLKSEPNLAIRMLQMLANRLVETDERLVE